MDFDKPVSEVKSKEQIVVARIVNVVLIIMLVAIVGGIVTAILISLLAYGRWAL